MRDYPWMTQGLMQDNSQFGDMLKDEKTKSQFVCCTLSNLWSTST